ncbi:MAG: hypothetical protein GWP04_12005 [Gammaproteobacteria bacterium]|nr:hypothetical protein [Gammaproteobacteria bacterium]
MRYRRLRRFGGPRMCCGYGPGMGHGHFMAFGSGPHGYRHGASRGGWGYGAWVEDDSEVEEDVRTYVADLEEVVKGLQDEIRDLKSRL